MNRDSVSDTALRLVLASGAIAALTNTTGLDTLGADAGGIDLIAGATAPVPTSIVAQESDDNSAWSNVADAEVIGPRTPAGVLALTQGWAANRTLRVGYVGTKRYFRLAITPSGSTTVTAIGRLTLLSAQPADNPNA